MSETLSIRIDAENPDHHLWNNHGTWWIHYTVHTDDWRVKRVRRSLGTRCRDTARARRDALLQELAIAADRARANASRPVSTLVSRSAPDGGRDGGEPPEGMRPDGDSPVAVA